jgi:hypothetical protein
VRRGADGHWRYLFDNNQGRQCDSAPDIAATVLTPIHELRQVTQAATASRRAASAAQFGGASGPIAINMTKERQRKHAMFERQVEAHFRNCPPMHVQCRKTAKIDARKIKPILRDR